MKHIEDYSEANSELSSENECEEEDDEASDVVEEPQPAHFSGCSIHHGSDPETYKCYVCDESGLSREQLAVHKSLNEVATNSCVSLQATTQLYSEKFQDTRNQQGNSLWRVEYDMLCIDVQHTDLRTPTAVVSHLEKLFKGIDSRVYKGTRNGYPSSRFAESGGHVDFNGMIDFERECTKDTTRPGIHYEYSPRDRFTFHSCTCCRQKTFLE